MSKDDFIKIGLIGHPVAQSQSPKLHNGWLAAYGLAGEYKSIDCALEALEETIRRLVSEGYRGFNVTVPHKQAVMDFCDEIDDLARAVGAVNTVVIRDDKLFGTNTDVFGFIQNIKEHAPDFDFKSGKAVVLGAGGAARAAVHGLLAEGMPEVLITNRTMEKAGDIRKSCADPACVNVIQWDERDAALVDCTLLVNTTSLGMISMPPLEISLDQLPRDALVNDIVYKPLMTDLLVNAKARGHNIVTGIDMLCHQARPAFELWTGVMPG